MQFPAILRPGFIAGLVILLSLSARATAQWAGFTDTSAALQTSTFSFIGTNPAAGDTNENYYDGDMGDFDGDGWMDRALIARYGLLLNSGGGVMTPVANTITGGTYRFGDKDGLGNDATQWADVDNDGDLDILQGGNGETLSLQINSAGRFSNKPIPNISALQIVNTDLEKDGDVDLVIAHSFCSDVQCGHGCPEGGCQGTGTWPKTFRVYRNDGTGTFTNVTTAAGFPSTWGDKLIVGLVSGDVDGDADFDLLMINGIDRAITLARNNGAGVFTLTNIPFAVALAAIRPISSGFSQGMNLGDIDGDGDLDLVCALVRDTAGSGSMMSSTSASKDSASASCKPVSPSAAMATNRVAIIAGDTEFAYDRVVVRGRKHRTDEAVTDNDMVRNINQLLREKKGRRELHGGISADG